MNEWFDWVWLIDNQWIHPPLLCPLVNANIPCGARPSDSGIASSHILSLCQSVIHNSHSTIHKTCWPLDTSVCCTTEHFFHNYCYNMHCHKPTCNFLYSFASCYIALYIFILPGSYPEQFCLEKLVLLYTTCCVVGMKAKYNTMYLWLNKFSLIIRYPTEIYYSHL